MSLAQIEAELEHLTPDELRSLLVKSWSLFVQKQGDPDVSEDNAELLTALDEAIARADATPGQGHKVDAVRAQINEWISR